MPKSNTMNSKSINGTILIVDDELVNLKILSQLLTKQNYHVCTAENGLEALASVNTNPPDLILLDIMLPDIDGFEVCTALKKNEDTSDIPVIFISALTQTKDILRGFAVGGIDYVTKPFIAEEVSARVSTHLEMCRMKSQLELQAIELKKRNQEVLQESEDYKQQKINELGLLSSATSYLLEIETTDEIYSFLRDTIHPLSGADYMLVTEFDEQSKTTIPKQIYGPKSALGNIISILGKDISNVHIPIKEVLNQMDLNLRKKLRLIEGGLYVLAVKSIPKTICFGIEKILGVNQLYSIGFIWNNNYYGGVTFGFKKGNQFKNRPLVESVIQQMSLVLSRKYTQKLLVSSEEKYRSIFENTGTATMIVDENTTILLSNEEGVRLTGYPQEHLIGSSWTSYVAPGNLDLLKQFSTKLRTNQGQVPGRIEVGLLNSKGEIRNVLLNAEMIPYSQNSVVSLLDITNLKKAEKELAKREEKYHAIFESIQDVYFEINIDGMIAEMSPSIHMLSRGLYHREDFIGNYISDFSLDREARSKLVYELKNRNQINDFELVLRNKDGSLITCSIAAEIKMNSNGKPEKIIGTFHDITERIQNREILKATKEKFNKAFEMAPVTMTISDEQNVFIDVNHAFVALTGYSRDETIGRHGQDLHLWADEDQRKWATDQFVKYGSVSQFDFHFRKKSGEIGVGIISLETITLDGKPAELATVLDITARKKAEESILKLSLAVEHSPVSILITDSLGKIEYANQKAAQVTGYSINDLIGEHTRIFSSGEMPKAEYEALWNTISTGKEWSGEFHNRKKNGELFWESASISSISNDKGIITHYIAIKEDVTERRLIEKALQHSEQGYRSIFNFAPVGIFRTDKNGVTTYVNPTWSQISGLSSEKAMGDGWLEVVHPEDQEKIRQGWIENTHKEGVSISEYRFIHPDGTTVWVTGKAVPERDAEGKTVGYIGVTTDVTKQKKLEKTKEILVNISNAVLATDSLETFSKFIFDELARLIKTNNFYIALYNAKTQMLSTPFISDEQEMDLTEFPAEKTLTGYVIKTGKSLLINEEDFEEFIKTGEVELVGAPSKVWVGVPLTVNNLVIGAIVVQNYEGEQMLNDEDLKVLEYAAPQISLAIERKKVFEDLKTALEKAHESDRLKSAFLANISHEIRTPMNGIMGFSTLLKEPGLTGDQQQEYIGIIEKSGLRMLNTIQDLMDISKIESGQMDIVMSEVDVNERINELYNFFKPKIEAKGLLFSIQNTLSQDESIILSDQKKVDSILSNLINNAIKYTHKGNIEVGCEIVEPIDEPYLQFYVKDTGIGIPTDRHEAIFDRFVHADIEDKAVYEGSGLGLAISKAFVEMLNGEIWLESKVGFGSTFYFTLPYREKQQITDDRSRTVTSNHVSGIIKKLNIIIADDDETSALFISLALKKYADKIITVESGLEVVAAFNDHPEIDLILMDIRMPELNGYEATRRIREISSEVVIIAQTAYGMAGDRQKALEAGCNDYISKPINKVLLSVIINKYFYSGKNSFGSEELMSE